MKNFYRTMSIVNGAVFIIALAPVDEALARLTEPALEPAGVVEITGDGSTPYFADVNGDELEDLIYTKTLPGPGVLCVHLNQGGGTAPFAASAVCSTVAPADSIGGIAFGDVNEDGHDDAVISSLTIGGSNVDVFLGTPSGAFQHVASFSNGSGNPPGVCFHSPFPSAAFKRLRLAAGQSLRVL